MSIPPEADENVISKKAPKLENLHDVEKYLENLKSEIQTGKINSKNINFIPIFQSIQAIVNAENLRIILKEFQKSSDLFSKKIKEIRTYISSLGGKEEFEKNVKLSSEDSLNAIFQSLYNPPFMIDDINIDGLLTSYLRLVTSKKRFTTIDFPDFSDIVKNENAEVFEGLIDDVHFERDLANFEKRILPNLPISITDMLNSASSQGDRYTYFVYCLYLIQRKKIIFDKTSNMLRLYKNENNVPEYE